MIKLTASMLRDYLVNYDYYVSLEQAENILELLDDTLVGCFTRVDIEMATDYILNRRSSMFTDYFE